MTLRKLELRDAPFMLEWMHDPSVVEKMNTDFSEKTIEDCQHFITKSQNDGNDIHMAIVDDADIYQGTVSLKNINRKWSNAEFAITIREGAMGKGVSKYGMKKIIEMAFENIGLSSVYWCVAPDNARAIRFYDKNGYNRIPYKTVIPYAKYRDEFVKTCLWYEVKNECE